MTNSPVVEFTVAGGIVPWARAGGRGRLRFTRRPQREYMATIRAAAAAAMAGRAAIDGPIELTITAVWEWPRRLSAKQRATAGVELKATRPDAGNVAKLIEDALNAIVWADDARVSDTHIYKRYGDAPGVTVAVRPL